MCEDLSCHNGTNTTPLFNNTELLLQSHLNNDRKDSKNKVFDQVVEGHNANLYINPNKQTSY